jgi:uncharacterized membrane protein YkvA (DUF1232 family)
MSLSIINIKILVKSKFFLKKTKKMKMKLKKKRKIIKKAFCKINKKIKYEELFILMTLLK